jgi:protein SCO1/2
VGDEELGHMQSKRLMFPSARARLTRAVASLPRGTRNALFAGIALLLVFSAMLAALGAAALVRQRQADALAARTLQGTSLNGAPAPDFTLTDQNGASVSLSALRGRPVVVTFLDSVCPHADCSLMAEYLTWSAQALGTRQTRQVAWVAISLDPWHDTPASVTAFLTSRQVTMPVRYLLGTPTQLAPIWQAYAMQTFLQPDGVVIHTTGVYVLDGQGHERVFLPEGFDPKVLSHDLGVLLNERGASPVAQSTADGLPANAVTQRQTVQGYAVAFTALPGSFGTYSYTVTVQDTQGVPVQGATVMADFTMPDMRMAPLRASLQSLAPGIPGAYRAQGVLAMLGHWRANVTVSLAGGVTLRPAFDYSVR